MWRVDKNVVLQQLPTGRIITIRQVTYFQPLLVFLKDRSSRYLLWFFGGPIWQQISQIKAKADFLNSAKIRMLQHEGFSCYTATYLAAVWAKLCFYSKERDWRILLCFCGTTKFKQLRQCSDLKTKVQPDKIMVPNQNEERGLLHCTGKNPLKPMINTP